MSQSVLLSDTFLGDGQERNGAVRRAPVVELRRIRARFAGEGWNERNGSGGRASVGGFVSEGYVVVGDGIKGTVVAEELLWVDVPPRVTSLSGDAPP